MAKKKTASRYGFTPEIKAEALRLIRDEGWTAKQAAELSGCTVSAIQQWKAAAKAGKIKVAAKKTVNGAGTAEPAAKSVKKAKKKRGRRKGAAATAGAAPVTKPTITFDEFVQDYWKKCPGASDVLRLPPDITPKAIEYVYDVLRYAYGRLGGE
jgi:transposase-like protein